ncbi:MAG: phenylalanine--tRNA ligase subunit beta [Planctomycetaceae bacterium]|nr:phenylalanine--tRNA ligase subunit beta [Planctomycetaceae bacterium]
MIVSWNWLKEYVRLDMPLDDLTHKLTMSGLNLEGIEDVDGDIAVDLEVTSNRPDCLGHIGVAREVAILFDTELTIPPAAVEPISEKTSAATSVEIECEDLCPRYYARVIRGIKVGPSPDWMQARLKSLGIACINNIVDITNYVLMECGQPLHAFDFDKLGGQRIVVRRGHKGEKIAAINHNEYELTEDMCIIADTEHPVAIGGVMGGADTEISDETTSILIETADFAQLSIRNTARALNLHSDSSYRFERTIDACQLDWASRRCCELILEIAGGELLDEPVIAGTVAEDTRPAIPLRFAQVNRLLGIDVSAEESSRILTSLGLKQHGEDSTDAGQFEPPSWRRDLTREADLIEEVARIYGYDRIPEDVKVPLQLSSRTVRDRTFDRIRDTLTSLGFFEAITISFVNDETAAMFTPFGAIDRLKVEHSSRKKENVLRQSLVPSLLQSRRENERHGNFNAELFETGSVYLAAKPGDQNAEPIMIGLVSGRSFGEVKGIVETLGHRFNAATEVTVKPSDNPQFVEGRGAEVLLGGESWGWVGELSRFVTDQLDLRDTVVCAELKLASLESIADFTPQYSEIARFPSVARDINFVLDEAVTWHEIESIVRDTAGSLLDSVTFGGQYRGKQIPADKKSYVVTINYRSPERTLTNDEVEQAQSAVIEACSKKLGAELRA